MRILTRYILKEICSYFLIGLLVFSFVIYIRPLSQLLELLVQHSLGPAAVAQLLLLPLPSILVLTMPMAVLLGTLLGLSRMASDNEVIAARASGIGRGQFVRPVLIFAALAWMATTWTSLRLAPLAARTLNRMEARVASTEAAYAIEPRVFIEQFPKVLLYIHDLGGSSNPWRGVFVASASPGGTRKITLARAGSLLSDPKSDRLTLHLLDGATHEFDPRHPDRYSVISFDVSDMPIEGLAGAASEKLRPAMLSLSELRRELGEPSKRAAALVELNYRFSLPFAALVLALVAIPLGLASRKGGKGFGLMLSILLVFLYYILMATGLDLAKQGRVNPVMGLWAANLLFGAGGLLMLLEMRRIRPRLQAIEGWLYTLARGVAWRREPLRPRPTAYRQKQAHAKRLFQILDGYILRSWLFYLLILTLTFAGTYMIFDFFQLLGDVVRNRVSLFVVLNYYWYLAPQVFYLILPLSALMATLVTFGLLAKRNEITAVKALGISLYRLSIPVFAMVLLLSGGMFLLADRYLPDTNQHQDALRNEIKGKPPQTSYRPGRQWIFGQSNRIYYYRYFDPARNVFADLSVFELDPASFRLTRRIHAQRAFWQDTVHGWVLENGWVRDLSGDKVASYRDFPVAIFSELTEKPDYFKTEVKPSEQMSAAELRHYIEGLQQSGFDVMSLWVAFYKKFSYPLVAFVVALIAIPFAFSGGARGSLSGVAASFGIAIVYWSLASVFEAMGNVGQLPPALAAWSPDVLFALAGAYLLLRVRT